jgi:hypothetical protein
LLGVTIVRRNIPGVPTPLERLTTGERGHARRSAINAMAMCASFGNLPLWIALKHPEGAATTPRLRTSICPVSMLQR